MCKFNDEFVSTKIDELFKLNIGRFFIEEDQIVAVKKILDLVGDTAEELTAKRNSVVKLFEEIKDEYDRTDWEMFDKYHYTMSGTVAVIDRLLFDMGSLY